MLTISNRNAFHAGRPLAYFVLIYNGQEPESLVTTSFGSDIDKGFVLIVVLTVVLMMNFAPAVASVRLNFYSTQLTV
jgi:hypothetical protein